MSGNGAINRINKFEGDNMSEDSAPRRFYVFKPDFRYNPSDFEFSNEAEALVNGTNYLGVHEVSVPGYLHPQKFGLPKLLATPHLILGEQRKELLDIYGFSTQFISDRAKRLLESLDPEAFEFAQCEAVDWLGRPLSPYWLARVVRVFDRFDEERSNFITYRERNPDDPEKDVNPAISELNTLVMLDDFPTSAHVFYLARYQHDFIVDKAFVERWIQSGFKGAKFSPLQYLTESEMSQPDVFGSNRFTQAQESGK